MPAIHWRGMLQPKTLFAWDNVITRSSSTSWLDGLRGVAAVQVFFFHFFGRHTDWGHTYGSTEQDHYLHQLPLIRSIWGAGSGAVATFFVISGYAITVKSLTLLRQGNYEGLYNGLCSSLFRRGFRLYLPVILLGIPSLLAIRIFDLTNGFMYPDEVSPTIWSQMGHFVNNTDHHINPFDYRGGMVENRYVYVPSAWTIPMEYYGSIVCYILMMVVSRMENYLYRCIVIIGMWLYALHQGSWWTSNFLFGMWLADHTLEQKSRAGTKASGRKGFLLILYWAIFVFGFYLSGMPPDIIAFDMSPAPKVGYMWLYELYPPMALIKIPERARWYWYWSGNLTFLGVCKLPHLQKLFNTKFCQWLGKISFSMYLVHAIVISILGGPLQGFIKGFTDHKGVICLFEFVPTVPVVIVLSGLVERYMDQPSVRFSKWLEGKAFQRQNQDASLELLNRPLMPDISLQEAYNTG